MSTAARSVLKNLQRSEKAIEWDLIKALRTLGFFVSKLSQPQRALMTEGVPDLVAMHYTWKQRWTYENGVQWAVQQPYPLVAWIEVKRPGQKPSTAQLSWHSHARACGQNIIVAHNLTELLTGLRELGAPIS